MVGRLPSLASLRCLCDRVRRLRHIPPPGDGSLREWQIDGGAGHAEQVGDLLDRVVVAVAADDTILTSATSRLGHGAADS